MKISRLTFLMVLIWGVFLPGLLGQATQVVTSVGFAYSPASVTITAGDTVNWTIASSHNVVEVSMMTYNNNGSTPLAGGFSTPFGGGKVKFNAPGTYYYVCTPHAGLAMKGIVTVTPAATNFEVFTAYLSGNQEIPSVPSLASGSVTARLDGATLAVEGFFENLSSDFNPAIGAHLHLGLAGANGPVVFPLVAMLNLNNRSGAFLEANNTFTLSAAQIDQLRNRQLYVNIHTFGNPAGELRGQLLPEGKTYFYTQLTGAAEPDPVYTDALGAFIFELDGTELVATGAFSNLKGNFTGQPAGGVHVHQGIAGINGGIELMLMPIVDPSQKAATFEAAGNTFTLTPAQATLLRERKLYVNVHSSTFPAGEIRGQIHGLAQAVFRAFLSGANEVPPLSVLGKGYILGELAGDTLLISGSFDGLESVFNPAIGAHLHSGYAGQNGPVVFHLMPVLNAGNRSGLFEAAMNKLALSGPQKQLLMERMMYFNIHTLANAPGELRGQLLPEANYVFNAYLTGSQETTPSNSLGYGGLVGEVRGSQLTVTGSFSGLASDYNPAIGSHFHRGVVGRNGPIAIDLMPMLDGNNRGAMFMAGDNTYSLGSGLKDSLLSRALYANIHTVGTPSGELRGQMMREAHAYFFAPLSGEAEAPMPILTPATGLTALELISGKATLYGAFGGLQSDIAFTIAGGAHIHAGLPSQTGPILRHLHLDPAADNRSAIFPADSNAFTLAATLTDSLRDGRFYVNVHSQNVPSGEIRGTFLPLAQQYLNAAFSGLNEVPPFASPGKGALKAALAGSRVVLAGSFNSLQGDFDPNIAGGSHLHRGANGSNGPIIRGLDVTLPDPTDLKNGAYLARQNTFTLSAGQIDSLAGELVYFNLHTTAKPSGEIRGQVLPEFNFFPENAPAFSAPASNSTVTLEGPLNTPFEATWTASADANPLAYIWQLSAARDFSSLILNVNTGAATAFVSDFETVDSILADAGVGAGDSLLLYHRAIASDGSLQTFGPADSVFLKRGMLTSLFRNHRNFGASLAPTRTADLLSVSLQSDRPGEASIEVISLQGVRIQSHRLNLIGGAQSFGLNLSALPAGIYLVRVQAAGYAPALLRAVKE